MKIMFKKFDAEILMKVANEGMNLGGWKSRYEWFEKDSYVAYDRAAFEYLSDYIKDTISELIVTCEEFESVLEKAEKPSNASRNGRSEHNRRRFKKGK